MTKFDKPPVIIGSGIAGLLTALPLAPADVVLVTAGQLQSESPTCSSVLAQGGIAAALGEDDSPAQHTVDTVAAGAYLGDQQVASNVAHAASEVIATLQRYGVQFDAQDDHQLRLGLEGGHLHRRIVHAADSTGAEIMRALEKAVADADHITVYENTTVKQLLTSHSPIADADPRPGQRITGVDLGHQTIATDQVVLATGGLGALFTHTTNPSVSSRCGMALAARIGARLRDLEFIQFHPTALAADSGSLPLISEAVRGEGATLVNENGEPLPVDPLATRDVVARAVWHAEQQGHQVFLDTKQVREVFSQRFPSIAQKCREAGIDPDRENIPIRAAAHYTMGGVVVDYRGRTSITGLWAAGEVAHTGLHGANRLASNSLLEAAAYAQWVAHDLKGWPTEDEKEFCFRADGHTASQIQNSHGQLRDEGEAEPEQLDHNELARIMSKALGIERDEHTLTEALHRLTAHINTNDNALMAYLMCVSALQRTTSVGAHYRTDSLPLRTSVENSNSAGHAPINATPLPERNAS